MMICYQEICVVMYLLITWIKIINQKTQYYCQEQDKGMILIHLLLTKSKQNGSHQRLWNRQYNFKRIKGHLGSMMFIDLLCFIDGVEMVTQLKILENCVITRDPQLLLAKYQILMKYLVDITHFHGVSIVVILKQM